MLILTCALPARAADNGELSGEDDFKNSPYTQYGEFNEAEDEESTLRYFQFGRFFGVSLGLGYEGVTGNRGKLWEGGFPALEFKLYYWFDFNFALSLVLASAKHNYNATSTGRVDVNMFRLGLELRYYFDVTDAAAGITFANPHLIGGLGSYTKTEKSVDTNETPQDASFGFCVGFGLEFPIVHRKSYFALEGKFHMVSFNDTNTAKFTSDGLSDLSGGFYTVGGNILFTW